MSENILVDGKPLHLLRVVDLREELKKRGIKATGTKSHLQELLISAITSVEESSELKDSKELDENKADNEATSNENSNASSDNNSESEPKVASISINEEKETIKLTIRSSPRKSEAPPQLEKPESDTESSQSETDSNSSPKAENVDNIGEKHDSPPNHTENADEGDSISSEPTVAEKTNDQIKEVSVEQNKKDDTAVSVNHDNHDNDDQQNSTLNEPLETRVEAKQIDKSPVKPNDKMDRKPVHETINDSDQPKELDKPLENDSNCKPAEPKSRVTPPAKSSSKKRASPEPVAVEQQMPNRRRLLSQSKSSVEKVEEPENESKNKTSIRARLLSHSKSVNEEDASKPVQKKRRWGGTQTSESSVMKKGISSDELKQLISESAVENDSSAKVSKANAEEESVQSTNDLTNNEPETKEEVKKVDVEFKPSPDTSSAKKSVLNEINENQPTETPKAEPESASRSVSPAKNPESTVLFVTGLVRPYTLPQLKKLLSANGSIDEEKFWIDKIKSKCYVVYSSNEEAAKTRASLHNLKWPQSSPKNLSVEFATLEDIDRCLHPENYEDLPQKTSPAKPVNDKIAVATIVNNKKEKDSLIEISKGKYDIILNEPAVRDGKTQAKNSNDDPSSRNVREWDRNKVNLSSARKENAEPEVRKRARHSPEREPPIQEKKEKISDRSKTPEKTRKNEEAPPREAIKKSESPAKMLEDLFRKTKATPYIYWLPLSEDQAIEKQKQREVLEKERQARIAARRESDGKRENTIQNRPPPGNFSRDRPPKFQDNNRRRSPTPPMRRKRSTSPVPRRPAARYSRSRSPDRRRAFSPRRRR